ncbi:MAG TPA: hypothetical protein VHX90_08695, partial [Verrucomicrobiae bacterium]|nr:hypothetical protein [Verrucomicrobiae bacterium]
PITIRTPNHERIYQIAKTTTRDVVKVETLGWATNSNQQQGIVVLNWNMLEQNDGVKIQIIYGGSVNLPLIVDGVIVGQKSINKAKPTNTGDIPMWVTVIVVIFVMFCAKTLLSMDKQLIGTKWRKYIFLAFAFGMIGLGFFMALFFHYLHTSQKPPFGF